MSQGANQIITTPPLSGGALVSQTNTALAALLTRYSGNSAPSSPVLFQPWIDTSVAGFATLKTWDGAQWIADVTWDLTNHLSAVALAASQYGANSGMVNGTIVETHAGNAVTFAVKTLAGADPSAVNPVYVYIRDSAGAYARRSITAALSVTIPSGQAIGALNGVPFRVWLAAMDNGGTIELVVRNCLSSSSPNMSVSGFGSSPITTLAVSGAGSAQVNYSTTARATKNFAVLGYFEYATGLATAGVWAASPSSVVLYGPGVPLPGDRLQSFTAYSSGAASTTSSTAQNGNTAQTVTPKSAFNYFEIECHIQATVNDAGNSIIVQYFRDTTALAAAGGLFANGSPSQNTLALVGSDTNVGTAAVTYRPKFASQNNVGTVTENVVCMHVREIQA
jgi:hypothetical protein